MRDLDECASDLATAYMLRAGHNKAIWQANQELAGRERALRPEAGWPGKNDEARVAAREAALMADQAWQNAAGNRDKAQAELAALEAEIAGIEAERRAAEWRIRERMVEMLTRGGIDAQSRGDRMEAAFDDTLQAGADQAVTEEMARAGEVVGDPPLEPEVEFPF